MTTSKYDWIIVGGGISGLSIAEILSREGKSVLLIEKNDQLASETSGGFHEWVHSGALYTLVPDNLLTLRYVLGATDDLLKFYQSFPRMNLVPSEAGVVPSRPGWFNSDRIEFRYRIRKFNPIWMALVSRSISIIKLISNHDWLRRKAGSEYGGSNIKARYWLDYVRHQVASNERFYTIKSPDITMNSRVLLSDLLEASLLNGLEVISGEEVLNVEEVNDHATVITENRRYHCENVVICGPDLISKLYNIPIKTGYAPIAVVENVPEQESSFVELDYYTKRCINLVKKEGGYGQAGGITVNAESDVLPYLDYVITEHQKRNPEVQVIDSYIGLKKELVSKGQNRNYLYHINQNSSRIWSVVLGKFTLAFSMAPEFYRRVYRENPSPHSAVVEKFNKNALISETAWQEIVNQRKEDGK